MPASSSKKRVTRRRSQAARAPARTFGHLQRCESWIRRNGWWLAGTMAVIAGVTMVTSLFVPYNGSEPHELDHYESILTFHIALGVGLLLIGGLLLWRRERSQLVGATALFVVAVLLADELVIEVVFSLQHGGEEKVGFYLHETGALLMVLGGVIAATSFLRPLLARDEWSLRGRGRLTGVVAFLGFSTAVGYSLNSFSDEFGAFGSSLDPFAPFAMVTALVAVVAITWVPVLAATTRRWAVAVGATLGFTVFALAWNFYNLSFAYWEEQPGPTDAIEGTWTLLAASLATILVLVYCIAQPLRRVTRSTARVAVRRPIAWASTLAFVAALFELASMFPRYFDTRFVSSSDAPTSLLTMVIVAGFALSGVLMLQRGREQVGAIALAVIVALFMYQPILEMFGTAEEFDPGVGMGFVLDKLAFLAAAVAAGIGTWTLRRTIRPGPLPVPSGVAVSAVLLAIATGAAYGLNPSRFQGSAGGSPFSNPFEFAVGPTWRVAWTAVLVVVLVPAMAWFIATGPRHVALGLFTGVTTFVLATSLFRLSIAYINGQMHDAEGTWMFVSAGPALVGLLGYQRFVRRPATTVTARR